MYLVKNKKSPYWQVVYEDVSGKTTTKSTGEKIKADAKKFLIAFQSKQELLLEINSRGRQQQEKKDEGPAITFTSFKQEYLNFISCIRSRSYFISLKYCFEVLEAFTGDKTKLNQLDSRTLEQFLSRIYKNSQSTAALYYRNLKAAFSKAVEWGYLNENPFKKFKLPRPMKKFPVFITREQLNLIVDNTADPVMKEIFLAAFHTGLRIGELLNLTWSSVDLTMQVLKVEISRTFLTKNKKERLVPVNKTLFEILKGRFPKVIELKGTSYVFRDKKGMKFNIDFVSKNFKKAVRKANLDDRIHFHSLRHSFASNLVQRGISLPVIKELLGHEDIVTTMIYSHLRHENLVEAVMRLEELDFGDHNNFAKKNPSEALKVFGSFIHNRLS